METEEADKSRGDAKSSRRTSHGLGVETGELMHSQGKSSAIQKVKEEQEEEKKSSCKVPDTIFFDFNQIWNLFTHFHKSPQPQFSSKSVQWKPS